MASHGHDEHGNELGHVASMQSLLTVFGALLVLTVVTVLAARVDFGGKQINLAVALMIATVKVTLVVLYFMHLRYDRLFHTVLVIAGLLAAALFIGFALVDRGQYENEVIWDKHNPPDLAPRDYTPPID